MFDDKKKHLTALTEIEILMTQDIFKKIEENFNSKNLIYKNGNLLFLHKANRDDYLDSYSGCIQKDNKQLIFFDPDNGFEPKKCKEKHIKYCEVKKFYDEMNDGSIIVVYQHSPQGGWGKFNLKTTELPKGSFVYKIVNSDVAYFLIAKNIFTLTDYTLEEISKPATA